MFKQRLVRLAATRRRTLIIAIVALAAPLAGVLGLAAPALASEPKGAFAVFKQCPRTTKGVNYCLYSKIESGEVKIGETAVPIKNPFILQGGYAENEETEVETFYGALNGETLQKVAQNVPGGLLDFIKCEEITGEGFLEVLARESCKATLEGPLAGVNAVTELAKPASSIGINTNNLVNEAGTALSLPVKIHLENPFLGSECYIGSSSNPVTFNLTTGTTSPPKPNSPISGKLGNYEIKLSEGLTYTEITNNTLVDNSFSVPKVNGCGGIFSLFINPIVDAKLGLESKSGHNTAIQNTTTRSALASHVIKSE
jgi:hypothetical protein